MVLFLSFRVQNRQYEIKYKWLLKFAQIPPLIIWNILVYFLNM